MRPLLLAFLAAGLVFLPPLRSPLASAAAGARQRPRPRPPARRRAASPAQPHVTPRAPVAGQRVTLRFKVMLGSGCSTRTRTAWLRLRHRRIRRRIRWKQPYGVGLCDAWFGWGNVAVPLGRLPAGTYQVHGIPALGKRPYRFVVRPRPRRHR